MQSSPCPKCGRICKQSGEVAIGDAVFPVFQCDECLKETELFGEKVEVALTWAVRSDGKTFDPAD